MYNDVKKDFIQFIIEKQFDFNHIVSHIPKIQLLEAIPQDPNFHKEGNVLNHTKQVCKQLLETPEWKELTTVNQSILYIAALFHDIGKLICTKIEKGGHITSPKHTILGAKYFREFCYKELSQTFQLDFTIREQICSFIRYHGLPVLFLYKPNIDYSLIKVAESISLADLALLAKADLLGRICDDWKPRLQQIEYFKEYASELDCLTSKKVFANQYSRFLYFNTENKHHADTIFDCTEFDVHIMCGLPLSGKDTYIQKELSDLPIISLDSIRQQLNILPTEKQGKVIATALENAKQYLRQKSPFVWNATNIIGDTRKKLCQLCFSYHARVNFFYIEAPYNELLLRNKIRERTIPENVLHNMIHKLDMVEPQEGYKVNYNIFNKLLN